MKTANPSVERTCNRQLRSSVARRSCQTLCGMTGHAVTDGFNFDLKAKRIRLSDGDLIVALQAAAEALGEGYFSSPQYDGLTGKRPHSATIIDRFGSWVLGKKPSR